MKIEDIKAIFLLEHCAERCEINAAIEALEKQIPKKPEIKDEYYVCPVCGVYQEISEGNPPHCINCGQRLLWEVEEDEV